jgi:hypothetical protein
MVSSTQGVAKGGKAAGVRVRVAPFSWAYGWRALLLPECSEAPSRAVPVGALAGGGRMGSRCTVPPVDRCNMESRTPAPPRRQHVSKRKGRGNTSANARAGATGYMSLLRLWGLRRAGGPRGRRGGGQQIQAQRHWQRDVCHLLSRIREESGVIGGRGAEGRMFVCAYECRYATPISAW